MIREHCGTKLVYERGRFIDSKLDYHVWKCTVCKKRFKQRVRKPKK